MTSIIQYDKTARELRQPRTEPQVWSKTKDEPITLANCIR